MVGRGLRGRENGGNVNNVQSKSNWNCHYTTPPPYNEYILIKKRKRKEEKKEGHSKLTQAV
jgi:hypothetical protein